MTVFIYGFADVNIGILFLYSKAFFSLAEKNIFK